MLQNCLLHYLVQYTKPGQNILRYLSTNSTRLLSSPSIGNHYWKFKACSISGTQKINGLLHQSAISPPHTNSSPHERTVPDRSVKIYNLAYPVRANSSTKPAPPPSFKSIYLLSCNLSIYPTIPRRRASHEIRPGTSPRAAPCAELSVVPSCRSLPLDRELELFTVGAGIFFLEGPFLVRHRASGGGIAAFDAKGSEFYVSGFMWEMGMMEAWAHAESPVEDDGAGKLWGRVRARF